MMLHRSEPATLITSPTADAADSLTIGLVNAMPGRASLAVERRFTELLCAGVGGLRLRLFLFRPSGVAAADDGRYLDVSALSAVRPDALIVTGAEPNTPDLAREAFWPSMTAAFDWAEAHAISLMASCLAAHAAVLHADGIARRRLPEKCFGVFSHRTTAPHPLTAGLPLRMKLPHSRWNDLCAATLEEHGYAILSRSQQAGVNLFARQRRCLFVGVQGHPEYAADTLWGEYRRDMMRFLNRERDQMPRWPLGCVPPALQAQLVAFCARAAALRRPDMMAEFPPLLAGPVPPWRASTVTLFGNWLQHVAAVKTSRRSPQRAAQPALPEVVPAAA